MFPLTRKARLKMELQCSWDISGRQKKSGLTHLNQQNSVNILAVRAYYAPNQQKFYKDHTELYKFDIDAVMGMLKISEI